MRKIAYAFTAAVLTLTIVWTARSQDPAIDVSTLPFSAAVKAGNTLYLSGQIPIRADGSIVEESVAEQTHQTMKNLEDALKSQDYSFDDVVSVTVYLADMKDYTEMNAAYRGYFKNGFPARACVGGLQLALGARMEISAIAYQGP